MNEDKKSDWSIGESEGPGWLNGMIQFCLENKLVVFLLVLFVFGWGLRVAPFDWDLGGLERDPVPVDAIPDIGENQQIVFTEWMGRSPQDVEDQISYPLTVSLLGIPGVKTVRSYSMFGFSSIYVIFDEDVEFYWSRSRVLEKLNSLPSGTLPAGVQPALGPDATALGQVFWYTLEGRDEEGNPTGGWDLHELRSIQDWQVRYALLAAEGVSEVASVGGFVQEYQVDVDPDAMRAYGVRLDEVVMAVKMSNRDVGARSIEVNKVEYVIRGLGFVKTVEDIENAVIKVRDNVPVYVKNVAHVGLGPALRRGALDKAGAEVVGGVVVVRYGDNPLAAIKNVKKQIKQIEAGLPKKTLADGTVSQVKVIPFYDRTGLIYETLGTLNTALYQEILVTVIVVLVMIRNLSISALISGLLPLAVLMSFIAMKVFGVDANIVALSGIAIAIGTMVPKDEQPNALEVIYYATSEVSGAVVTAIATTVVGFLPVFVMEAAEGKLFKPLAFTKTFALIASVIVALTIIPPLAHILLPKRPGKRVLRRFVSAGAMLLGVGVMFVFPWWLGAIITAIAAFHLVKDLLPERARTMVPSVLNWVLVLLITLLLAHDWLPLGPERGLLLNALFVGGAIGLILLLVHLFQRVYAPMLRWSLDHKGLFLTLPAVVILLGVIIWMGFDSVFGWLPQSIRTSRPVAKVAHIFPGLGKEFMPPLDEGSYLFMPTTMPHASIGEALDILQKQDMAISAIPEVESAVGKIGRVDSPLDPAPISMVETIINYKPEFLVERGGRRRKFSYDTSATDFYRNEAGEPVPAPDGEPYRVYGKYIRDEEGQLIPDDGGSPFRLWRPPLDPDLNPGRDAWAGVDEPDDIWDRIVEVARVPGSTAAPRLQPIAARIVMLQSGMRAPMGVKVKGPDLETIEKVGLKIEELLRQVPTIKANTVNADRIIGKPYLEIDIDRKAIARYGIMLERVQQVIEVAIGGKQLTTTVEGRERYPVRVRYKRELRDQIESLGRILVPAPDGTQIPIEQLAQINYVRGPQMIKSEDTFLVGYVTFDKKPGYAEVDVVRGAQNYLQERIEEGEFDVPAGVSYEFAGSYENQVRAEAKLKVVVPVALGIIFLILYMQFRSVLTSLLVFTGIFVAWAGGFILIWLYGQPWFLDFSIFGVYMRELFQVHPINLSVAIWVGFLALFGIASDNGVIVATILDQMFRTRAIEETDEIRETTVAGAERRIRPALMTSATTILALLPILTSTGRGADIMVPMAIPSFGGMLIALLTVFVVPVLYCAIKEMKQRGSSAG
jgi:Cu(I)/Ag(I) efflux system membrane protein CusA/SilA